MVSIKAMANHYKNMRSISGSYAVRNAMKIWMIEIMRDLKCSYTKHQQCIYLNTRMIELEAQKIILKAPKKIKLIDLSADFRLKNTKLYNKWNCIVN